MLIFKFNFILKINRHCHLLNLKFMWFSKCFSYIFLLYGFISSLRCVHGDIWGLFQRNILWANQNTFTQEPNKFNGFEAMFPKCWTLITASADGHMWPGSSGEVQFLLAHTRIAAARNYCTRIYMQMNTPLFFCNMRYRYTVIKRICHSTKSPTN